MRNKLKDFDVLSILYLSLFPGQLHSFLLLVICVHSHELALYAGAHACSCDAQGHMHFQKLPVTFRTTHCD